MSNENKDAEAALKSKEDELKKAQDELEASKKEVERLQKQKNVSSKEASEQALSADGVFAPASNQSDPHAKVSVFINSKDSRYLVNSKTAEHPFNHVDVYNNGKHFIVPCDQYVEVPMFIANILGQGVTDRKPKAVSPDVFKAEVLSEPKVH